VANSVSCIRALARAGAHLDQVGGKVRFFETATRTSKTRRPFSPLTPLALAGVLRRVNAVGELVALGAVHYGITALTAPFTFICTMGLPLELMATLAGTSMMDMPNVMNTGFGWQPFVPAPRFTDGTADERALISRILTRAVCEPVPRARAFYHEHWRDRTGRHAREG
jgi:hypothetical protein